MHLLDTGKPDGDGTLIDSPLGKAINYMADSIINYNENGSHSESADQMAEAGAELAEMILDLLEDLGLLLPE